MTFALLTNILDVNQKKERCSIAQLFILTIFAEGLTK